MDNSDFVNALKKVKQLKDSNKKSVEKIKNTDLNDKRKIVTNIVNQKLLKKMIDEGTMYYKDFRLLWVDLNGNQHTIDTVIGYFEKELEDTK